MSPARRGTCPTISCKPDENQLSDAGLAYLERLLPKKFKVGKPFV